jgi:hypothetical protein
MSFPIIRRKLARLIGPLGITIVVLQPLIDWGVQSIQQARLIARNPYAINDLYLVLVLVMLIVIHEAIQSRAGIGAGDESKIIMNRNQSDYYEIWEEVRAYRDVQIDAVGHSFNTLWFNFIKKFLYEVLANEKQFESVTIRLVSTRSNPTSYADIRDFYARLDDAMKRRITIILCSVPSDTFFFTGLCVNKRALWLSIREPHTMPKVNEHVREWRRSQGGSAEKMVNWFDSIADYLAGRGPVAVLNRDYKVTISPRDGQAVESAGITGDTGNR